LYQSQIGQRHQRDLPAKAALAAKIIAEIQRRRLMQSQVAAIRGIDQPQAMGRVAGASESLRLRTCNFLVTV